jgi:hypothetical protein
MRKAAAVVAVEESGARLAHRSGCMRTLDSVRCLVRCLPDERLLGCLPEWLLVLP